MAWLNVTVEPETEWRFGGAQRSAAKIEVLG